MNMSKEETLYRNRTLINAVKGKSENKFILSNLNRIYMLTNSYIHNLIKYDDDFINHILLYFDITASNINIEDVFEMNGIIHKETLRTLVHNDTNVMASYERLNELLEYILITFIFPIKSITH